MSIRNRLMAFLMGFALLGSLAGTAVAAAPTGDSFVEISAGELTVTVDFYDFNDVGFSLNRQVTLGNGIATISDLRGTYVGWKVTIASVSQFTGQTSGYVIPQTNGNGAADTGIWWRNPLVLPSADEVAGQELASTWLTGSGMIGVGLRGHPSTPSAGLSVPGSTGVYKVTFPVQLMIPGGAPADTYKSTVTLDVVPNGAP